MSADGIFVVCPSIARKPVISAPTVRNSFHVVPVKESSQ